MNTSIAIPPRVAKRAVLAVLLTGAALVAACGGSDTATSPTPVPPPTPPTVASVALSSENITIPVGRTASLTASARDASGNIIPGRAITWSSSADAIAQVNANGVVSAIAVGTATITASSDGKSASARLVVTPVIAAAVVVSRDTATLTLGATTSLSAVVKDDQGNTLADRPIRWTSASPHIATVDSITGTVRAVAGGVAIITATSDGKSATVRIAVRVPVATVTVQTALDTLEAHDQVALTAVLRDANTALLSDRPVRWSSSNPAVAIVDSVTGVLTGLDRGTVTVTATSEGKTGTATRVVVIKYRSIVAGTQHSCDIASGGIVWCWGENGTDGRIGIAELGEYVMSSTPVRVPMFGPNGVRAVQLSTYGRHTCALDAQGKAYCWGNNGWGKLGVDGVGVSSTPRAVGGGHSFKQLAISGDHSCGLTLAGKIFCWGRNDSRQFAAISPGSTSMPVAVAPALTFASITTGSHHTCGVMANGQAYCWGYNGLGNLGDGLRISFGNTYTTDPTLVVGGHSWKMLGGGQTHACGLTTAGQIYCWGSNGGRLGNGAATNETSTPYPVSGDAIYRTVAVGANHSCGIALDDALWCWGSNVSGQSGAPPTTLTTRPVRVGITAAEVAAAGIATGSGVHTCAIAVDRLTVRCWGRNETGQLGNGTTTPVATAQHVPQIVQGQRPL